MSKKEMTDSPEGLKQGLSLYFKGVKSEWGKITWPERAQVVQETVVVLFVVFFFTVLVYILDILFRWLLGSIPNR